MFMKAFLVALSDRAKKDYPDYDFEFYVSRRSKFVHMGLDVPLIALRDHWKIIEFIRKYWNENKEDDLFKPCTPRLISATKFKYDYIIFEKI